MKSEAVLMRRLAAGAMVSLLLLAGCGGGASPAPINHTTPTGSNPAPTITTISPNNTIAGSVTFTLTIIGTNFVAASVINFGGSALATTFIDSTQLFANIPPANVASTGTLAVTVTNPAPGGGTSNAVNFSITSPSPPTINYLYPTCVPAGEQSFPLQVVGPYPGANFETGSVVRWNGSARPTTIDAVNGLVAQISTSDVAAAGTASVTVFNPGTGGGSSNALSFAITTGTVGPESIAMDPAGKFAYVASAGCNGSSGGYVSGYTINATTGALSRGSTAPTDDEFTDAVTVDPSGKFVYATSSGDVWDIDFGSVSTYTINSTTGVLTSTAGGITGTGVTGTPGYFNSVVVDPSGKFAYAAEGGAFPEGSFGGLSDVAMFTIDSTTGALTSNGMIAAGSGPDSVAVDPAGKFAYVTNYYSNDVSMYTIDAATGALASIGTIAAGTGPMSVAVDPAGDFAYVSNYVSNNVSIYTLDATTGALTSIGSIAAGTNPFSVAVDPAGKFAYVANWTFDTNGSVSMYTIDATTGVLTSIGTIATEVSPTSIVVHPSGKFVYVTNSGSSSISIYSIDSASGVLTLLETSGS